MQNCKLIFEAGAGLCHCSCLCSGFDAVGAALGAVSGVYRPSCAGAAVLSDGGGGRDAAGGDLSGAVPADAGRQEKQPPADLITGDAAVFCLDADYQRCGADYLCAVCSAGFTADQSNAAAGMGGDPANDCCQHRQYADARWAIRRICT